MRLIKIGDKVECIISSHNNGNYYGKIEKGKIYTVTGITGIADNTCINVDNQTFGFFANKFIKKNRRR